MMSRPITVLPKPTRWVLPPELDRLPRSELVSAMAGVISQVAPQRVYLPHPADSHSDHRVTWFRQTSVREVSGLRDPSGTGFGIDPSTQAFRPNVYIDISDHLEAKMAALSFYHEEFAPHPFPRSADGVRAQATLRGGESGCLAAEAFMLLRALER